MSTVEQMIVVCGFIFTILLIPLLYLLDVRAARRRRKAVKIAQLSRLLHSRLDEEWLRVALDYVGHSEQFLELSVAGRVRRKDAEILRELSEALQVDAEELLEEQLRLMRSEHGY